MNNRVRVKFIMLASVVVLVVYAGCEVVGYAASINFETTRRALEYSLGVLTLLAMLIAILLISGGEL